MSRVASVTVVIAIFGASASVASAENYQPLPEPEEGYDAIEFVRFTTIGDVAGRNDWEVSAGSTLIADRTFRGVIQYCGIVHTGYGRVALGCIERRGDGFYAYGKNLELPVGSWRTTKVKIQNRRLQACF